MKTLVLFSGGPDSTAAVYLLKEKNENIHLLTLSDPQKARNDGEILAARKIANLLCLSYTEVDISSLNALLNGLPNILISLGTGGEKKSDFVHGEEGAPLSSQLLHTLGAVHGIANGFDRMIWGVHQGDDKLAGEGWLADYLIHFNNLLEHSGFQFRIEAPFLNYTKSELLAKALRLGAPLDLTFSCITPGVTEQCGKCKGCIDRQQALQEIKERKYELT